MIPRELFAWAVEQWWSAPAFALLVMATLIIGGALLALATQTPVPEVRTADEGENA